VAQLCHAQQCATSAMQPLATGALVHMRGLTRAVAAEHSVLCQRHKWLCVNHDKLAKCTCLLTYDPKAALLEFVVEAPRVMCACQQW
jgi:hypothetical protein